MRWATGMLLFCLWGLIWGLEPNLLTNGGMERDSDLDGLADGWRAEVHRHEGGEGFFSLDPNEKVLGRFSQRIVHTSKRGWVRASQIGLPARPNSPYLFRCWVKADCRFLLIVYVFKDSNRYDTFPIAIGNGTDGQWRLFSGIVKTPPDATSFKISLITDSRGTAWFDGAELILLSRPPYVLVPITTKAPNLDGHLSDECWRDAEPLTPFLSLKTSRPADPPTVARVVATLDRLFIAFRCIEPDPKGMRLKTPESGEPAYRDDCVEVFLDTDHDHRRYIHLVVTPKGNRFAEVIDRTRRHRSWWRIGWGQRAWKGKWEAAVRLGKGLWTAEIAIPFAELGITPKAGQVFGINLCRSRKVGGKEQNSAFVFLARQTFHRPERFVHLVFAGVTRSSPLRLQKAVLKQSPKPKFPLTLVPHPQRVIWRGGLVALGVKTKLVIPRGATPLERKAGEKVRETLRWRTKISLPIGSQLPKGPAFILLTTLPRLPRRLHDVLPLNEMKTFFSQRGKEAYVLFVGKPSSSVVLVGASERGVWNGAQTLRQMIALAMRPSRKVLLPEAEVWDFPDLPLRGWHMRSPLKTELVFYRRLLELMALLKFNTVVWEVNERLRYERHPDIASPQAPTKEQLRSLVRHAKSLGFEVIPQVQTFGHFNYVLNRPRYRHLAELSKPTSRGYWAYCPSNPATYSLVFDLFEEVLDVFRPRWFHIGHDEITFVPIGVCQRCQGKPGWQLLADDVRKLYRFLRGKGVQRVAMWCDQLEPERTGGYRPYLTHFATGSLPKDIVLFCWHYQPRRVFRWLTDLQDKGFPVVACGWYHAENVWHFTREAFDRGALGYCGTTWFSPTGFASVPDLMSALILGAENAWSVGIPTIEKMVHPIPIAFDLWAIVGERGWWKGSVTSFHCVDLTPFVNAPFGAAGKGVVPGSVPELDEKAGTIVCWDGIPFWLPKWGDGLGVVFFADAETPHRASPDLLILPLQKSLRCLYLLMTTTQRPDPTETLYIRLRTDPKKVATLTVRYRDGREIRYDLIYRQHLTEWNDRLGCGRARLVWQGKTEKGDLVTLCAYAWENPRPHVPIEWVMVQTALSFVRPALVAITIGE